MGKKVPYSVEDFNPTPAQAAKGMKHSVYAVARTKTTLSIYDLAEKMADGSTYTQGEILGMLDRLDTVMRQELLEGNACQLGNVKGEVLTTLKASVKGSVSDAEIEAITTAAHAQDASVAIRRVAEKSDLKADKLSVTVKALIGKNFGEWFRQNKALERVKSQGFYVPDDDENPANQGGNNGGGSNSEEIG